MTALIALVSALFFFLSLFAWAVNLPVVPIFVAYCITMLILIVVRVE